MALVVGDKVAATILPITVTPLGQVVQGPMFGVVDSGSDPWDVLWRDGRFAEGVAGTSLDKIGAAADATREALVGRRVKVTAPTGQNNWGLAVCVDCYTRQVNGAGGTVEMALLCNPAGYFAEVLASNCEAIPG